MNIKEKLLKIETIAGTLEGAYKDDKGTGEYQDAKRIGQLIRAILKSLG